MSDKSKDDKLQAKPFYEFTKCPSCGSERRILEEECQAQIKAGKLPEGTVIPAHMSQSVLFNPTPVQNIILARHVVPVMVSQFDICAECGTLYLTRMDRRNALMEAQQASQSQVNFTQQ